MPSTSELPARGAARVAAAGTIDCDLWGYKPAYPDLKDYLSESWRHFLRLDGPVEPGVNIALPESQYFVAGSAVAGIASVDEAVEQLRGYLDRSGIAAAVLNPGAAASVAGLSNPMLSADVARAVNEWTSERWLAADGRLRGSIVVSPREPARAAAEIRRAGADPRMVQVLLAYPQVLLGHRVLRPVYEAAAELGLPVDLIAGGDFSGANGGVSALGRPGGSRLEGLLAWQTGAQPHLVNLLASDTLARFPELRFVLNGFGVAWLPSLLWRLDMEARDRRIDLPPSLPERPSEVLAERVRLTTATLELPEQPERLAALLDSVDASRLLLYASGPRRERDASPEDVAALFDWDAVGGGNARAFFARL